MRTTVLVALLALTCVAALAAWRGVGAWPGSAPADDPLCRPGAGTSAHAGATP